MSIHADRIIAVRTNKTLYRDGTTVLKVFGSAYSKVNVFREALNQSYVEKCGLNVPEVLEVVKLDNKWAIRWEYVSGDSIQQLMDNSPDNCDELTERFIKIQAEIFSHKCPELPHMKDVIKEKIAAAPLEKSLKHKLNDYLKHMPEGESICHGDFLPVNVVIDKNGKHCIFDWTRVTQGDAAADIAQTYILLSMRNSVGFADKYLKAICEYTHISKNAVSAWLAPVAAAYYSTCRPAECAEIMTWINYIYNI